MKEWKEYLFKVNGFEMTAVYNEDTIQKVFLPLLKQLQQLQKEKKERIIVFMAAPVSYTHLDVYKRQILYLQECIKLLLSQN